MIGHSDNQPILWIVDTIEIQKVLDFSFIQRYFPSRNQENPRKEIRFTFFSKVLNHALGTFQKSASSNFYCVLKKQNNRVRISGEIGIRDTFGWLQC